MKSATNMQHTFAQVPSVEIPRSKFNRASGHKTAIDAGILYPIYVDEALPGDTMQMDATFFGRFATQLKPLLDNVYLDVHWFSVPLRLVWENFQRFMGEQPNPGDPVDFIVPEITVPAGGFDEQTLYDYMGIPPNVEHGFISALAPRAYALIWNEWYRDQNLQDSIAVATDDGPDLDTLYELLPRGKRHDYFTSCLPWPQKGPAVELPLGTSATVTGDVNTNDANILWIGASQATEKTMSTGAGATAVNINSSYATASGAFRFGTETGLQLENGIADLSTATAATINQLRMAFQLQRLYERDARGGTRYTEILRAHFGVTSPDQRLQRPEYLGGGTTQLSTTPVPSNINANLATPAQWIGDLGAYATMLDNNGFTHSFVEHCLVIGLVSIRADLNYQQGLHRMWTRQTKHDFYWPALSHIGEQAVLQKELLADGTAADDEVFGYQERWAEYRYKPNQVTGRMRSTSSLPLDIWHLAQEFDPMSPPALNEDFIKENPPISRIVAVQTEPALLLDCYFGLQHTRPMPTYSVPGLIDHF